MVSKRVAPRLADLAPAEVADLFLLTQTVASALQAHHAAPGLTLAVQDGPAAGQTVPHASQGSVWFGVR